MERGIKYIVYYLDSNSEVVEVEFFRAQNYTVAWHRAEKHLREHGYADFALEQ